MNQGNAKSPSDIQYLALTDSLTTSDRSASHHPKGQYAAIAEIVVGFKCNRLTLLVPSSGNNLQPNQDVLGIRRCTLDFSTLKATSTQAIVTYPNIPILAVN
ncbi:MAG TPA: hypothetical protein V6D26_29310 [Stenomitos sp.]